MYVVANNSTHGIVTSENVVIRSIIVVSRPLIDAAVAFLLCCCVRSTITRTKAALLTLSRLYPHDDIQQQSSVWYDIPDIYDIQVIISGTTYQVCNIDVSQRGT